MGTLESELRALRWGKQGKGALSLSIHDKTSDEMRVQINGKVFVSLFFRDLLIITLTTTYFSVDIPEKKIVA